MSFEQDHPVLPAIDRAQDDPFIRKLSAARKKWVVLTDDEAQPRLLLNANARLREFFAARQSR